MPRNPSVAHSAQNSLGVGRSMCELRAEFGCASGQLRGQAVFVEEGQVEHELRDGLLRQLGGARHLLWKRRLWGGRHLLRMQRDKQSCPFAVILFAI